MQSMQLVDVSLSSSHSAVLGTQLVKGYITHSSAPPHNSHVPPALEWLPALLPEVWSTGLEQGGTPTSTTPS